MHLSDLKSGEEGIIVKVLGHGGFRKRILEMGFVRGQKVTAILNAPLKDPIKYKVMDYEVSLRRNEAAMIEIVKESALPKGDSAIGTTYHEDISIEHATPKESYSEKSKEINIALVGNPNSGKTSLFNALCGKHEHVGNYSGVTVDAKSGQLKYKGYTLNITDLPGTYAITAYSPEEVYVRRFLMEKAPDIILNAVVASNLERNLYLTTELIDINQKSVVALNMYDELEGSGARLDYLNLGKLIGIPMVPVVAKEKVGLERLLDTIIDVYESDGYVEQKESEVSKIIRHIHIKYSPAIEKEIKLISNEIKQDDGDFPKVFPPRYWSIKLLEGDKELDKILSKTPNYQKWQKMRDEATERIKRQLGEDVESAITNEKYGFISGAIKETYTPGAKEKNSITEIIDSVVTNKVLSFPIFLFLMWFMFYTTYTLGAYPQEWLESLMGALGNGVSNLMSEGPLRDLIVDGIIGGVGSVVVFLPNILILYLFISLMEDSGYMARAAFIMDKLMHKIGLHGKSFIPLVMGFGCNVPAIISARTIESRSSRLITILINPFISCSARIPVYVLIAGTFFPKNSASVLMLLYILGIVVAIITARLLRKFLFKEDETPFVMELPPYRTPTLHATLTHLWEKCMQYLKKIGNIILLASMVIWFLSYYPAKRETAQAIEKGSYLEQMGKAVEPVMEPLGLNWKASVALISGAAAKEIVVSTLGVLYTPQDEVTTAVQPTEEATQAAPEVTADEEYLLSSRLLKSGDFTKSAAMALMVFVLLYFPCIGTIATIAHEAGSWKYALFSALYSTTVAWIVAFITYNICNLFGGGQI